MVIRIDFDIGLHLCQIKGHADTNLLFIVGFTIKNIKWFSSVSVECYEHYNDILYRDSFLQIQLESEFRREWQIRNTGLS